MPKKASTLKKFEIDHLGASRALNIKRDAKKQSCVPSIKNTPPNKTLYGLNTISLSTAAIVRLASRW